MIEFTNISILGNADGKDEESGKLLELKKRDPRDGSKREAILLVLDEEGGLELPIEDVVKRVGQLGFEVSQSYVSQVRVEERGARFKAPAKKEEEYTDPDVLDSRTALLAIKAYDRRGRLARIEQTFEEIEKRFGSIERFLEFLRVYKEIRSDE